MPPDRGWIIGGSDPTAQPSDPIPQGTPLRPHGLRRTMKLARSRRARLDRDFCVGAGMKYKAFISYSRAADDLLAPPLESALKHLGKPWYRLRTARCFRDRANLAASPALLVGDRAGPGRVRVFRSAGVTPGREVRKRPAGGGLLERPPAADQPTDRADRRRGALGWGRLRLGGDGCPAAPAGGGVRGGAGSR